jgi:ADP-ribosylglycohydrolase
VSPIIAERLQGLVYGQAIGDALGVGGEFHSEHDMRRIYPEGLSEYEQIRRSSHAGLWEPGEWTDDTEQFLAVLESLLDSGVAEDDVDLGDMARRFRQWLARDGRGIGNLTFVVLTHECFLEAPHEIARQLWEQRGRRSAPNGAVMRTASLAILPWERDLQAAARTVRAVCELTHADPRCAWSCLVTSFVAACLVRGDDDIPGACERAMVCGRALRLDEAAGEETRNWIEMALCGERGKGRAIKFIGHDPGRGYCLKTLYAGLGDLSLGQGPGQGFTMRTMAAGLWAAWHAESFADGLLPIINSGGDADTNGAVAGALLGARFGGSGLPLRWVEGLVNRERLDAALQRMQPAPGNER